MDRYQHVIRWSMNSHFHKEQFQVTRDMYTHEPIGMNFWVGSATPYVMKWENGKEPDFQVLYMDPDTLLPVDLETYSFDLERANVKNEPRWTRKYSIKESYGLPDLSPKSFYNYAQRIMFEEDVAKKVRNHYRIDLDKLEEPCPYSCRIYYYCMAISGDYDEYQYCSGKDKFDLDGLRVLSSLEHSIVHHWYEPKG